MSNDDLFPPKPATFSRELQDTFGREIRTAEIGRAAEISDFNFEQTELELDVEEFRRRYLDSWLEYMQPKWEKAADEYDAQIAKLMQEPPAK